MRSKGFIEQVRQSAHQNRIWTPQDELLDVRTNRNWPLCLTCGREVEAAELKNVNQLGFEIWASCSHRGEKNPPAEDYYKVTFPFRIDGDPLDDERANIMLQRAMGDFCPFPRSHEE